MAEHKGYDGKTTDTALLEYKINLLTEAIKGYSEKNEKEIKELEADFVRQLKEQHHEFTQEVKQLNAQISNGLKTQLTGLKIDVAVLKTRASWWGAIWGGISGLIIALVTLMTKILEKVGFKP